MAKAPRASNIADAATCGEDPEGNLRRMIGLAPEHCAGCADYHIGNAAVRLLNNAPWKRGARAALMSALRPAFAEFARSGSDRFDVVVAATADTAALSTCAHVARSMGEAVLARTRFTVLDRCHTPLILCKEYADEHGLYLQTEALDLTETLNAFPADLIVVHHLLPFVQEDRQVKLLTTLGNWLKGGGRIVLWQDVAGPGDDEPDRLTRMQRLADLTAMVEEGRIAINEPKEIFFGRLQRYVLGNGPGGSNLSDIDSLRDLIAAAGLEISSMDVRPHNCPLRSRRYIMTVAKRSSHLSKSCR